MTTEIRAVELVVRRASESRVRALIDGAGAELLHHGVELGGHHADLNFDSWVIPKVSTSFSIRRVDIPSR